MDVFEGPEPDTPRPGANDDPLGHAPCLASLPAPILEALRRRAAPHHVRRGAVLVRQGTTESRLTFVLSGQIKVTRPVEGGRVRIMRILGAGECWCGAPLNGSVPSPVSLECHADGDVISLKAGEVAAALSDLPGAASGMVACLGRRLNELIAEAADDPRLPVRRRMARALLRLARRPQAPSGEPVTLKGITHEDLASLVGTVREVASRALGAFEREGILRTGRGRIVILDFARLERAAEP